MKRNVIALICASMIAVALMLPLGLQGKVDPSKPISGIAITQADNSSDQAGNLAAPDAAPAAPVATNDQASGNPPDGSDYVSDVILVGLADDVTIDQLNARLHELDYIATEAISADDVMHGYVQLQLAEDMSVEEAMARIESEAFVKAVQPNFIYYAQDASPEDAAYSAANLKAGESNDLSSQSTVIDDDYADQQWALEAVKAYEAWDYCRAEDVGAGGKAVTVAIIDSGLNTEHPDLASSRIVGARNYTNITSYQDTSYTDDVTDDFGHGTHVAGIIAATANNDIGIAGVSYNARIMPVKVLDNKGLTDTWKVAKALNYIVSAKDEYNVKVVNISIGKLTDSVSMTDTYLNLDLQSAHKAGLLIVYAAGNGVVSDNHGNPYRCIPCDFDTAEGAIGVISVKRNSDGTIERNDFSNYNMPGQTTKELSAPGGSILSTSIEGDQGPIEYLTIEGEEAYQYGTKSGTSMAAPYVSGIAAMLFTADPTLTASDVEQKLINNVTQLGKDGWDNDTGYGLVNAEKALKATVPDAAPTLSGESVVGAGMTEELSILHSGERTWTWESSDTDHLTVTLGDPTTTATVTGVASNENPVTVTATSNDGIVLTLEIRVVGKNIADAVVSDIPAQKYNAITGARPEPTVTYGEKQLTKNTDYELTYESNFEVGNSAVVIITGKGEYSGQKRVPFEIYSPFAHAVVTIENPDAQVYDGTELQPVVSVKIPAEYNGGTEATLTENNDYKVAYSNNVDAGNSAKVTVTGWGIYANLPSITQTFSILPADISKNVMTSIENQSYTGSALKPVPSISIGEEQLLNNVDFTLSYENNVNATTESSKAKAIATGKGNYTGSVEIEFAIAPGELNSLTVSPTSYAYNGTERNPTVTVKDKNGKTLSSGTDYDLTCSGDRIAPGEYTYTATGKGNYTGSKSGSFSIAKSSLGSVTLSPSSYQYDGTEKNPTVTVKDTAGRVLKEGTDYTLSKPADRTSVGTHTYTASPMGNYEGASKSAKLNITKASLSNATITLSQYSYAYDGTAKTPTVTVKMNGKTLTRNKDYVVSYTSNLSVGTATVTVTAMSPGNYSGSRSATFKIIPSAADKSTQHRVQYSTHVQNVGWQKLVADGATAGTSGRGLRLEGIYVSLKDHPYSGSIQYRTHIQNIGWQGWKSDGQMSGTSGKSLRLEAIQIRLTGQMAAHYDVYYRVHAQNIGWMAWAKNGESAGTAGYSYRLEAIQIILVPKGSSAPTPSPRNAYSSSFKADQIQYRTHVQNDGWQDYVGDGATAGTSGRSLRLEGINIRLGSQSGISGGVEYRTHVQNIGWQGWRSNGAMSGTSGRSLRLEAIQIRLTGAAASKYDIYYRVHSQNIGWMGWAKNGAPAGTAGYAYRLEAIQIKLVPKGGRAPGSTAYAYRQR